MALTTTRPAAHREVVGIPTLARGGWVDRVLGSDPGLNTLRHALQGLVSVAAALGAVVLFVRLTHALQIRTHGARLSAAQAAAVAAANHGFLLIAMVVAGVAALVAAFTSGGEPVTTLFLAVPLIGALAGGIALAPYQFAALISFPVVLAVGAYLQRFGQRGVVVGMALFVGDMVGFNLGHGGITPGRTGWLAAEIGVGVGAAVVVRYVVFYPRPARALRRTQRSYAARARKVIALVVELLENPRRGARTADRLHHHLVRLNEAALMIDAHLADPAAVADGPLAQLLHQRLFDTELALGNMARFAEAMTRDGLPAAHLVDARLALRGLIKADYEAARAHAAQLIDLLPPAGPALDDDHAAVLTHRFAESVIALADAITEWLAAGADAGAGDTFQQEPIRRPSSGGVHGTAKVSHIASRERGTRLAHRIRLPLYTRSAIQVAIAAGLATAGGYALAGNHFYWAVLAVFVPFMGTNTSDERIRKSVGRVTGTVAGVVIGDLIVRAIGHNQWSSLVVVLICVFCVFYTLRINFTIFFIAVTVIAAQLYQQTGTFSTSLLRERVEATALGAAAAIVVVLLVLPLRSRRVLRVALRDLVQAVKRLAVHASEDLHGKSLPGNDDDPSATLRSDLRALDAAYHSLNVTAEPMRLPLFGLPAEDIGGVLRLASAARNYSRDLVADTERARRSGPREGLDLELASATLSRSLDVIVSAVTGSRDTAYTRSSALFDRAERRLESSSRTVVPEQRVLRDLMLIDGTMAELAGILQLPIAAYDTERTG